MFSLAADGSSVHSNQTEIHDRLEHVLARHKASRYQAPISNHTQQAFKALSIRLQDEDRPLILDSGCGVGESTRHLAEAYPDAWVVGVDKSEHRLAKQGVDGLLQEHHCFFVRANLVDFWRLALQACWSLERHYLLYPNPWPKSEHLKRRWHGHAVFPSLLALGGSLELRSNWRIYVQEFEFALTHYHQTTLVNWQFKPEKIMTAFERKYLDRSEPLFQLCAQLDGKALFSN